MPVFKIISVKNSVIGIWEMTEETAELEREVLQFLSPKEKEKYNTFKSDTRRKEWLAIRLLLKKMRGRFGYTPIYYGPTCKPFVEDEFIGISHSRDFAAIIKSQKGKVAIDIERISAKPVKISSKFVADSEKEIFDLSSQKDMTLLWSVKETVYKHYGQKELSFKEQIIVEKLDTNKNEVIVILRNDSFLYVKFEQIKDHFMTYIAI